VEAAPHTFILDTGAEVSIVPRDFLATTNAVNQTVHSHTVKAFGRGDVLIEGPYYLNTEICGVRFVHPYYVSSKDPLYVAGYDLITKAKLVIDSSNRCVWSYYTCTPQGMPTCSSSSAIDASVHCFTTTVIDSILQDLTPADRWLQLCLHEHVFGISNATAYYVPSLPLPSPSTPFVSSGPCADVSPFAQLVDRSSRAPHSSLKDRRLADDYDLCLLDTANPRPVDASVLKGFSSHTLQIDELQDTLPEHVRELFQLTVEEAPSTCCTHDLLHGLRDFLRVHQHTFATSSTDLGYCSILQHHIDTGDSPPIKQSPRRPPLAARDAEDQILDEMLESGVIEPSDSPLASPVCLVRKKDGTLRFCVDYRRVNAVSRRDAFPIPDIHDDLDHLRGAKYFATVDLLSGYWQLGMTDRAKERSAFCTRRGLFHFTRMPFGLSGAPASFCRLMSIVLRDMSWQICLCYLDDIIIFAITPQELLDRLHQVFTRLAEVGLKVKPSKTVLFKTEIEFLGHLVTPKALTRCQTSYRPSETGLHRIACEMFEPSLDVRPTIDALFATSQPLLNR